MRLPLALGVAFAAFSMAAYAQPRQEDHTVVVRHGGHGDFNPDTNNDGWISRQEASDAADRAFDQMDSNHDGRLTSDDHVMHMANMDVDVEVTEGGGQRVRVIQRDRDDDDQEAPHAEREEHSEGERVERTVTVVRVEGGAEWQERDGDAAPVPPVPPVPGVAPMPPVPPHPPMFMMMFANSEEADLNGDGALSREEFRAQHLRFFDAGDGNNDGRIRYTPPPEPPAPPAPPEPPRPPRPHH